MKDRTFADVIAGALACVCALGFYAVLRETECCAEERRRADSARWELPRAERRSHSPEDDCRHCTGIGACRECAPSPCRLCGGSGLQPRDAGMASRLYALWDGAA